MLKIEQKDNIYEVVVESNNKVIGYFIQDVDGYYYFAPNGYNEGGVWSDYILLEIGTKLKAINKPWDDQINEYFKKDQNQNTFNWQNGVFY
jgi:hypothetical protein